MARVWSAIINGREWRHPGRAQQLDTTTKLGIHCEAVRAIMMPPPLSRAAHSLAPADTSKSATPQLQANFNSAATGPSLRTVQHLTRWPTPRTAHTVLTTAGKKNETPRRKPRQSTVRPRHCRTVTTPSAPHTPPPAPYPPLPLPLPLPSSTPLDSRLH